MGGKIRAGDIFYGYDFRKINLTENAQMLLNNKSEKVPDIVLVKKKYNNYKRIFKLKHLQIDEMEECDEIY